MRWIHFAVPATYLPFLFMKNSILWKSIHIITITEYKQHQKLDTYKNTEKKVTIYKTHELLLIYFLPNCTDF